MEKNYTDYKLRFIRAKINNLIYYRLKVEESLWEDRFRCQYIHQLKGLRSTILDLLEDSSIRNSEKWLIDIVNLIPAKLTSNQCLEVIVKLKGYVESGK